MKKEMGARMQKRQVIAVNAGNSVKLVFSTYYRLKSNLNAFSLSKILLSRLKNRQNASQQTLAKIVLLAYAFLRDSFGRAVADAVHGAVPAAPERV